MGDAGDRLPQEDDEYVHPEDTWAPEDRPRYPLDGAIGRPDPPGPFGIAAKFLDESDSEATTGELETIQLAGSDGQPFLEARVPRIERRFRSNLHRVENLTVRLGSWRGELDLVLGRRAPVAELVTDEGHLLAVPDPADGEALRAAVLHALAEGFAGGVVVDGEGRVSGRVALPDPIAATVDLEALRADYEAWCGAAGVLELKPNERWHGTIETVAELIGYAFDDIDGTSWAEHMWQLGDGGYSTGTVDGGIKHGLVVGDDPATTCAYILSRVTDDGDRWWHALR